MDHQPPAFHLYKPDSTALRLPGGPRSAGAYHSGDLAYLFGTLDRVGEDWQRSDRVLSETLVRYWTNVARTGDPNGAGLTNWRPCSPERHPTLVLDDAPHMTDGVRKAELDAMAAAHPH